MFGLHCAGESSAFQFALGGIGVFLECSADCFLLWQCYGDTLEFGLMTDFHGCVKPSGREKTWPHEVAREAIRGHEWHITRYNRVLPPEHDCIFPFNRLVQGHADYTPVVFEEKELIGYTHARELAQGIIFSASSRFCRIECTSRNKKKTYFTDLAKFCKKLKQYRFIANILKLLLT